MAELPIDFTELAEQAGNMDQKLGDLLVQMQQALEQQTPAEEDSAARDLTKTASVKTTSKASSGTLSKPCKTAPVLTSSSASWTGSVSSRSMRIGSSTSSRSGSESCFVRFADDMRQLGEDDLPHRQLDGRA